MVLNKKINFSDLLVLGPFYYNGFIEGVIGLKEEWIALNSEMQDNFKSECAANANNNDDIVSFKIYSNKEIELDSFINTSSNNKLENSKRKTLKTNHETASKAKQIITKWINLDENIFTIEQCYEKIIKNEKNANKEFDFSCTGPYIDMAKDFYCKKTGRKIKNHDENDSEQVNDNELFYDYVDGVLKNNDGYYLFNDHAKSKIKLKFFKPFSKDPFDIKTQKFENENWFIQNTSQKWHFFVSVLMYIDAANNPDNEELNKIVEKKNSSLLIGNIQYIKFENNNENNNVIIIGKNKNKEYTNQAGWKKYLFEQLNLMV